MSKTRNPLTPERWKYLKQLRPPKPRFFHVSVFFTRKSEEDQNGVTRSWWERSTPVTYKKDKIVVQPLL